jgi:predicted class III extradiol MEMO1 family dioxygenase
LICEQNIKDIVVISPEHFGLGKKLMITMNFKKYIGQSKKLPLKQHYEQELV